tara:strand:- start:1917 stop:6878 length:4962 start_codon:yes stop_codon:yes gene_type:complete
MNSILIESNRIIADSQLQKGSTEEQTQTTDNHETLDNNASWNTTIDTGIELKAGDTIQLEAAALNINGAGSGNFQQFNGKVDVPDSDGIFRKDNAMDIDIVYYTTNNCQFNFPLPSARHMVELNDVFQGDYGGPTFSGRFLWRPRPKNFNTYYGASPFPIEASICWDWATPNYGEGGLGSDPAYQYIEHHFIMNQCSYLNGPATNNQCYGGYYFNGMNLNIPPNQTIGTAAQKKAFTEGLANCAAYTNWGAMVPWTNMPGIQFGADLGDIKYPDKYAVGYDQGSGGGTADVRLPYSNNINVEIKSRFTSEGYFPSGQNGGTAPQLLRGNLNLTAPKVASALGGIDNGNYPQDWHDYNVKGPGDYQYEMRDEPAMFRGSAYNNKPNSNKHYHPQLDEFKYYCRGPYYNNEFNNLVNTDNPAVVGDANMDGLQNLHTYSRAGGWWKFQTKRINIELQTGNIAPSRVSEIITDAMKVHDGNADDPQTTFIKQETYQPDEIALRDNIAGNLVAVEQAGISGKSFATVETIAGSCLSAAQKPELSNGEFGWDAINSDNLDDTALTAKTKGIGADFNINQAKMKYWSNMLSGNPFEWSVCTYCLPIMQYRPFVYEDVNNPAIWKGYKYWSIYTGDHKIESGANSFAHIFNDRKRVDGTRSVVKIGEYGDNSIMMETPRKQKSLIKSVPYRGLWNIQSCISNDPSGPPGTGGPVLKGPYRIQSYPYGLWDIDPPVIIAPGNPEGYDPIRGQLGHDPAYYNLFAPASPKSLLSPSSTGEYDCILTNIIFDGQMTIRELDKQMRQIEGHDIVDGNDTLLSQSNEFYNNTWVKWKMGRLNDQMTFPDQYIDDYLTNYKAYEGQKGVAQYLPNVYQTMRMYENNNGVPKPKQVYEAGVRQNISDILTNASAEPHYPTDSIQGSYSMCPLKMGIYEGENTGATGYTDTFNPDLYPCPENGPPQYPNHTTPLPGVQGGGNGQPPSIPGKVQDTWRYGPPCWGFFKCEMTQDFDGNPLGENETGFKKIIDRSFNGFRYLPQGQPSKLAYTAINAWNETIYTGLSDEWTTKPATMPYEEFEDIWSKLLALNDGRGAGVIPVFHRKTKTTTFNNIPFLAVIYQSHEHLDMPSPERGEHIMLGTSPSLSQNDLSFPATTQQRFDTHFATGWQGNQQQGAIIGDRKPKPEEIQKCIDDTGTPSINAPSMYVGTNDPIWSFDNTYNRYAYSKFHTNFFKGNGVYQYGNAGASADPETPEVIVKGQMSAFSKSLTLPNSCSMVRNQTSTTAFLPLRYCENIQHNWIWDSNSPGGWLDATTPTPSVSHTPNIQYGSPKSATQWEMKFMPNSGGQDRNIPNIDGIMNPALCDGPPQANKFDNGFTIPDNIVPYAFIRQAIKKYPTISAQSGVGILSLAIPRIDGKALPISKTDYKLFKGSLFAKMGFVLNQFLPLFYQVQTQLDHILFNKYARADAPAGEAYRNCPYPVSTQALISTSLTPALSSLFGVEVHDPPITSPINTQYPSYKLGMLIPAGRTNAISESVFALNLPQKLNFPYLVCRTNIMTPTSLQYIGGPNGQQILPAIAYLMTNYATNDFFYIQKSDLIFTVNRAYTLTEIRTSIHLPNGELADKILDGNSAVIYRINKAAPQDPKTAEEDKKFHDELLGIDPKTER